MSPKSGAHFLWASDLGLITPHGYHIHRCDITTICCDITSDVIWWQFGIIAVETHQNASHTTLWRQWQLSDRCVEFCRREVLESCSPLADTNHRIILIELIVDRIQYLPPMPLWWRRPRLLLSYIREEESSEMTRESSARCRELISEDSLSRTVMSTILMRCCMRRRIKKLISRYNISIIEESTSSRRPFHVWQMRGSGPCTSM